MRRFPVRFLFLAATVLLLLFSCRGRSVEERGEGPVVIALNFPSYDAARAVMGEHGSLRMLLPAGADSHGYEPDPEDMIALLDADLFIYGGGESDEWVAKVLSSLGGDIGTFVLMEHVPVLLEEETGGILEHEEGHEHEDGHGHASYDEHVWTSLENEIAIVRALSDRLSSIDPGYADSYRSNAEAYVYRIEEVKSGFEELFSSRDDPFMLVADRFPIVYFVNEFGIDYISAFPGCAENTEPSMKTVKMLIDIVRDEGIEYIFHMENTNKMLSDVICEDTGCKAVEFNSIHNISRRQFEEGLDYVDFMNVNLGVMKEVFSE